MHSETINHDQSTPRVSAVVISVGVALVFVLLVSGASYYFFKGTVSSEMAQKEGEPMSRDLQKLHQEEERSLNGSRMPISSAMKAVVQDYKHE